MGSSASKKAAKAQQQAAQQAQALQQETLLQQRADQAPFMKTGVAANSRLATLLGLSGGAGTSYTNQDLAGGDFSANADLYAKSPEYKAAYDKTVADHYAAYHTNPGLAKGSDLGMFESGIVSNGFDPVAYSKSLQTNNEQDPEYGSLLRKFTNEDMQADPVYQSGLQFGLDQGTGAINARSIQRGGYDSGATLKELTRYANDYGSTKANESYNRFTNDQSNTFNKLSGVSGAGQVATGQVQNATQNYGNTASGLLTDAGSARSAGIVGEANAWGNALSGISGAVGNYQNNQLLQQMINKKSGYTY